MDGAFSRADMTAARTLRLYWCRWPPTLPWMMRVVGEGRDEASMRRASIGGEAACHETDGWAPVKLGWTRDLTPLSP